MVQGHRSRGTGHNSQSQTFMCVHSCAQPAPRCVHTCTPPACMGVWAVGSALPLHPSNEFPHCGCCFFFLVLVWLGFLGFFWLFLLLLFNPLI